MRRQLRGWAWDAAAIARLGVGWGVGFNYQNEHQDPDARLTCDNGPPARARRSGLTGASVGCGGNCEVGRGMRRQLRGWAWDAAAIARLGVGWGVGFNYQNEHQDPDARLTCDNGPPARARRSGLTGANAQKRTNGRERAEAGQRVIQRNPYGSGWEQTRKRRGAKCTTPFVVEIPSEIRPRASALVFVRVTGPKPRRTNPMRSCSRADRVRYNRNHRASS